MGALSGPYSGGEQLAALSSSDVDRLIGDLVNRFAPEGDTLDDILSPLIRLLLFHPSLAQPDGLSGADSGWRAILIGLEVLLKHKPLCQMITRLQEWCPENADAAHIETMSLLGPLARLGVFAREWVSMPCSCHNPLSLNGDEAIYREVLLLELSISEPGGCGIN